MRSVWICLLALAPMAGSAGCLGGRAPLGPNTARDIPPEAPVVTVAVTAQKYRFTPATITVPEGSHAVIELTSPDVEHGFAIEGYRVNVTIPAKGTARAEFYAYRPGIFPFRCSRFCGWGHYRMKGRLIVESRPEETGQPAGEEPEAPDASKEDQPPPQIAPPENSEPPAEDEEKTAPATTEPAQPEA